MTPLKFGGLMLGVGVATAAGVAAFAPTSGPSSADAYSARPTAPPEPAPPVVPIHRYVTKHGSSFGYQSAMSENDLAAGLATKSLVLVDFNGMVQGDYSFTTYNPVSGNMIVMRCAEPCQFMNVMNYDHRMPEVFPITAGSVMDAIVLDARAGLLNP